MKCTNVRKHLVALADGQLAGRKLAAVQDHLQICVECRGLLQALRSDAELLRLDPRPALPDALATRVMSRIRAADKPPVSRSPRFGSWLLASGFPPHRLPAAAALFILAIGLWLGATLGQTLFRQSWESRQRAIVAECGLPLDDFANQLFGGYR